MVSGFEWLALLTLAAIVCWAISLYMQVYKPFLVTTILLLFFGLLWYFTTPASKAVIFGFSALFVFSLLGYIGLGLGVIGMLYIIKGRGII